MDVEMEVPVDMEKYVALFLEFFKCYEWVYNFKAIEILLHGNIQKMPFQFQETFKSLHDNDFQHILEHRLQESWSAELKSFINYCLLLKCAENGSSSDCRPGPDHLTCQSPQSQNVLEIPGKWSKKKYAEVLSLSEFVGENYRKFSCDKAVDIGSGLGYLSIKIAESFGASVIAVEGQPGRSITAEKSLTGKNKQTPVDVKFVNMYLGKEIVNQISPLVVSCNRVCLTGLHACGELSNISLKLFTSHCKYVYLSIVPCCYHKMDLINFDNFPLSQVFRKRFSENILQNKRLLGYQFCRLASQRSGAEFLRNILGETKQLFFRSVLEYYVQKEGFQLARTKRRIRSCNFNNFGEYLSNCIGHQGMYLIVSKPQAEVEITQHLRNLTEIHDEMLVWWKPITGMIALQGALQKLAEQFVLLDKVQFLLESPEVSDVKLKRIISESVSPRGLVVYAVKGQVISLCR